MPTVPPYGITRAPSRGRVPVVFVDGLLFAASAALAALALWQLPLVALPVIVAFAALVAVVG